MAWAERKVPKANGKIRSMDIARIWEANGVELICEYCRRRLVYEGTVVSGGPVGGFTVDHRVPKCRGGKDEWHNLVACCHNCNSQKRDKTDAEYRDWLAAKGINPEQQWIVPWIMEKFYS